MLQLHIPKAYKNGDFSYTTGRKYWYRLATKTIALKNLKGKKKNQQIIGSIHNRFSVV